VLEQHALVDGVGEVDQQGQRIAAVGRGVAEAVADIPGVGQVRQRPCRERTGGLPVGWDRKGRERLWRYVRSWPELT
jgi:hypothetical protein